MSVHPYHRVHPQIVKETEKSLLSFFKNRHYLPESARNLNSQQIRYYIKKILDSDFCKKLMSRYYLLGKGYLKWTDIIASITGRFFIPSPINKFVKMTNLSKDIIYMFGETSMYLFAFHDYPVYRVDENLINFLEHTELPKSFDFLQSIPLILFILPQGRFLDEEGISINYMLVQLGLFSNLWKTHHSPEYMELYNSLIIGNEPEQYRNSISVIFANQYIYWSRLILKDGKLVEISQNKEKYLSDNDIKIEMTKLAVHLISIIHNEPNLIVVEDEDDLPNNLAPKGFSTKPIPFSYPRKIKIPWDEKYQVVHKIKLDAKNNSEFTKTKCTHWRRGHWRRLPGDKERLVWVRPTLVNPYYE